jgi:predicted transposase/invertase (TIGR01784 family)
LAQSQGASSLLNAILAGEGVELGTILSVTPQPYSKRYPRQRGSRVDIRVTTAGNELIIIEVQLYLEPYIALRNWFAASQLVAPSLPAGTRTSEFAQKLPRIIVVNLLDFDIRADNAEIVQPMKIVFTKQPQRVAMEHFAIYNVQFPSFRKVVVDWSDDLHCWLYVLDTARQKNLTIQEVIDMIPELRPFVERNAGFRQFNRQYEAATADPEVRQEYAQWLNDMLREQGEKEGAYITGHNEGKAEGKAEGKIEIAKNLLSDGIALEVIARYTGLALTEIEALRDELKN